MTRSTFQRQMRWLAVNGYQGIALSEFTAWRENDTPLPPRSVLITFDDAYDETAQYAFPILNRLGFSAACMVVTGQIAKVNQWDVNQGWKPRPLMNQQALLEWQPRGIEYGAHTCNHPDLRTLSESDLRHELTGSRNALEQVTGSPVRVLAYPYGYVDRRVRDQAARTYDFAFITEPRPSTLATDPLLLGRMEPMPTDSYLDFLFRVRWGWTPRPRVDALLNRAFGRIRKISGQAKTNGELHAQSVPKS